MAFYRAVVSTDSGGDGDNLDANGNPVWNGSFQGYLAGIRYEFDAGTAATADTTVSEPVGLKRTIDSLTDTNTATTRTPSNAVTGATDFFLPYLVDSANLKVVVAQGGADVTDAVTVIVQIEEGRR